MAYFIFRSYPILFLIISKCWFSFCFAHFINPVLTPAVWFWAMSVYLLVASEGSLIFVMTLCFSPTSLGSSASFFLFISFSCLPWALILYKWSFSLRFCCCCCLSMRVCLAVSFSSMATQSGYMFFVNLFSLIITFFSCSIFAELFWWFLFYSDSYLTEISLSLTSFFAKHLRGWGHDSIQQRISFIYRDAS